MNLVDSFNSIDKKKLSPLKDNHVYSVEEFWKKEIKPNLLPSEIASAWFQMLKQYIEEPDAVFMIRSGNVRPDEPGYPKGNPFKLRRGFLTKYCNTNNDKISFVYNDNDFAVYILKLAYDNNFDPSKSGSHLELKNALLNRTIPIRFNASCKEEKAKSAFNISGLCPQIGTSGYKVSHIIDAGSNYDFGDEKIGLAEICKRYFPLGEYDDWKDDGSNEYSRIFTKNITNKEKDFLKAHFLRLSCPFNYILTPKRDHQINRIKIFQNDIGELTDLQKYTMQQLKVIYGNDYQEYLKLVMFPNTSDSVVDYGKTKIDCEYSIKIGKSSESKYDDLTKLKVAHYFLNNTQGLIHIEEKILGLKGKKGWACKGILDSLGIANSKKGVLLTSTIISELSKSEGVYKETLQKIKNLVDSGDIF